MIKKKPPHRKLAMFLLLSIAIALCAVPLQSEGARVKSWYCFDSDKYKLYHALELLETGSGGDPPAPIIKAWVTSQPLAVGGGSSKGTIITGGIVKDAAYKTEGLTHRWDFDLNQNDGTYEAMFSIEPNGTGSYYYFGSQKTANPSLVTKCEKSK